MLNLIRQGDVSLLRQSQLPSSAVRRHETIAVIPGETGNRHQLTGVELFESNGEAFAVVPHGQSRSLVHEEHPAVQVPSGVWLISTQESFDWPEWKEPEVVEHPAAPKPRTATRPIERRLPHPD